MGGVLVTWGRSMGMSEGGGERGDDGASERREDDNASGTDPTVGVGAMEDTAEVPEPDATADAVWELRTELIEMNRGGREELTKGKKSR